ncbi:transcriptional regulator, TetR family [Syntrophotalea carbinolica DSM 2380]|uniref:Transcriptional regulator, TetR family n=1 Tax=Syntrophotalea carbinolica (strain DSM 2380 / NBRC 103641 / GraBd1) TaxID=338963 RepID=Q3A7U8_SYNC1|nr:TetR/AcrR family transcriptional regulator [Syntrophotalea carbinolica]ABA87546.1 transcriptional regulator, TetR family [Syntrophotalea carbinolica DSM 2380]
MKKIADKRSALLRAALDLFAENGFNASPTSLIAKRAGVASGTLFVHFKNKEGLIRELYKEVSAQLDDLVWNNSEDLPFRERFLSAFSQYLRFFLAHPKEFRFGEQYYFSPFCDSESDTTGDNQKVRELLLQAREQKVIKDLPLVVLESIAFGPIVSLAKEHAIRAIPVDEKMIEQIVQACWDGLQS